jgi:hypothetical protein
MADPRPIAAADAVVRAKSMVGLDSPYFLGTGDYRPDVVNDVPWTAAPDGTLGSDCAGFAISWCYKLPRHRPGYNRGAWATVSDDLNTNSALEDAQHAGDLFELVDDGDALVPGDLLMYPTIRVTGDDGNVHTFIGHVQLVIDPRGAVGGGHFAACLVAHCHGPNRRAPGVTLSDGSVMDLHNQSWPKPQHRAYAVRARQ